MARITTNAVWMGVGAAGALVDVSSYANLEVGVSYQAGRQSDFEDAPVGEFSFELDNADGRFTPDNIASVAAAGYSVTVAEGMVVCWQLGSRLVAGRVRGVEPVFPSDDAAWATIRVTCDDELGRLARITLAGSMAGLVAAAGAYAFWPHNDAAGSTAAQDVSGNGQPSFRVPGYSAGAQLATFGYAPDAGSVETQAQFIPDGSTFQYWSTYGDSFSVPTFKMNSAGAFGFRITPQAWSLDTSLWFQLTVALGNGKYFRFNAGYSGVPLWMAAQWFPSSTLFGVSMTPGVSSYFSVVFRISGANLVADMYQDGTFYVSYSTAHGGLISAAQLAVIQVEFATASTSPLAKYVISDVSYTSDQVRGEYVAQATVASAAKAAVATVAPEVTLAAVPATFGIAGAKTDFQGSALDGLNEALKAEQGYAYPTTTGTVGAPTTVLTLRERTRPSTITYTFDATRELDGAPQFVRDLTNMFSQVTVSGATADRVVNSGQYTNTELVARVGEASTSESVILTQPNELTVWGQDFLNRGANIKLRAVSITIDAMTTPSDRSADLLAANFGDRFQVTALPSTVLGFSTWDGWLVGREERHTLTEHTFTLYFQPVLPDTGIFDTNFFMGGTDLTLSAGITNVATSMSVATATATTLLETVTFPYTLLIDSEQVTVTACTSATPQVATVTRGVNGTTAAAHSSGAVVEITPASLYAF